MNIAAKALSLGCAVLAAALAPTGRGRNPVTPTSSPLRCTSTARPSKPWPGYGIYLGNGLILTAAHVPGNFATSMPHVVIAGQDLPAALVKQGDLDSVDLTLMSIDATKLPVRLQMRRMPLCERAPYAGEAVVVATPEGTARSRVLPRQAIPAESARAVRHDNRRCRHHRKFRLRSI